MTHAQKTIIAAIIILVIHSLTCGANPNMSNTADNQAASSTKTGHTQAAGQTQPTPHSPLIKKWRIRIPILILIAWCAWLAVLFLLQDRMLFPISWIQAPDPNPDLNGGELLRLPLKSGGEVEAWYFPAPGNRPRPLCIYFHGNGELIDDNRHIVTGYHRLGISVLMPEYRGYGRSAGKPSQKAILADAARFHNLITRRPEVDPARLIYHGRSLGGGVAAALTLEHPPAALVFDCTFFSVQSMAAKYGAPGFLVRNPFRTDKALAGLTLPIIIFHGTNDHIIPARHSRDLARIARHAELYEYPCGHNDFPGIDNYYDHWNKIQRFLKAAKIL